MESDARRLKSWVSEAAQKLGVPGAAVGIYLTGIEEFAFYGVTSTDNPLPVDETTLFQIASIGKTFTATAIMCLVNRGLVRLDEPVRAYVPELRLKDEEVARKVTLAHLLNHTAGWEGDFPIQFDNSGDDVLARYVEAMSDLDQVSPLGTTYSYSNSSFALADRVIEKVTGKTIEQALKDLLLEPIGLKQSLFFLNQIMTRRFAVGHIRHSDGTISMVPTWGESRGGGISSTAADLLGWACFHLGDGRAKDGKTILPQALLARMQEPTFQKPLGDAIGIGWHLRAIDGVHLAGHGGSAVGQFAECLIARAREFALVSLVNSGPNGIQFNREFIRWALETYLELADRIPEPLSPNQNELAGYAGTYESNTLICQMGIDGDQLLMTMKVRPEVLAAAGEDDPDFPPMHLGLLRDDDRYVVTDGPYGGLQGYFIRHEPDDIAGFDFGGRPMTRTAS